MPAKDELLHKLVQSTAVVQLKYGSHSGLAIEEDHCVSMMCTSLEEVLLHKVKFRRSMTVANIIKDCDDDILVWDLITRFLTKSEVLRFENETSLNSGIGRFRSWLRSTLNDGLLEKYLLLISQTDVNLLRNYYEIGSIMLDIGLSETLPDVVAGMATVLFAFDLDRNTLNTPLRLDRTMSATLPAASKPTLARSTSKIKRRIKRPEIVEIVEPEATAGKPSNLNEIANIMMADASAHVDFTMLGGLIHGTQNEMNSDEEFRMRLKTDGGGISIEPKEPTKIISPEPTTPSYLSVSEIMEQDFEVGMIVDVSMEQSEDTDGRSIIVEGDMPLSADADAVADAVAAPDTDTTGIQTETDVATNERSVANEEGVVNKADVVNAPDVVNVALRERTISDIPENISEETSDYDPYPELPRSSQVITHNPYAPRKVMGPEVATSPTQSSTLVSSTVPTSTPAPVVHQQRSFSLTTERLPPLGHVSPNLQTSEPFPLQFTLDDQFAISDAVSLSSDISSFRGSFRSTGDGIEAESVTSSNGITYTVGELRNVLTSLLAQKEESEEQNRCLQDTLSREMELRLTLKEDISQMQSQYLHRQGHDQAVIRGLQRENQMLKQQLKKYVGAIQQMRRDDTLPNDLTSVLVEVPVIRPLQLPASTPLNTFDSSILENKLAQVSEMHGELVELNQRLVTKNVAREKQLQDLETKLIQMEAKETERNEKRKDKKVVRPDYSDFQVVESPLLQTWIPTAMIRGEGANKHHVYQVIIQVPGEQWTVYKRYAEFRLFHKVLIHRHTYFSRLELPGKNHFNRKVPSVVEDRRRKLEVYLQTVTSNLADKKLGVDTLTMDLVGMPCKATVTAAIHFFRERPEHDDRNAGL